MHKEIGSMIGPVVDYVFGMVEALNISVSPIGRSLKNELGAKSDYQLEDKLIKNLKSR